MQTSIERYDKRVVIQNVSGPIGCNSCLASMAAALQALGEHTSYVYLMGASSRAFRLQFSWCPSAPSAHIGFKTWPAALQAAGYEWEQHNLVGMDAVPESVRAAVRASIDAGRPVLFGSEEDGVLVGYEPISAENPTGWLRRPGPVGPPPEADEAYVLPVKKIPLGVAMLREGTDGVPHRGARALWSLRMAVANARRGDVDGLAIGFAAWEKWIRELGDVERIVAETRQELEGKGRGEEDAAFAIQLGNAWCYESLLFARQDAAEYLRDVKRDVPSDAVAHLERAADEYEALHGRLTEDAECFLDIAPYPWMKDRSWTKDIRADQAERLRRAYEHEKNAISAIENALAVLEPRIEQGERSIIIRGFEEMDWGGGFFTRQDSYMACLAAIMQGIDPEFTYADVMGLSGAAFKVCVNEPKWCASAPVAGAAGLGEPDRARSVLGLKQHVIELGNDPGVETWGKARKAIVSHIGEGIPLLVMDGEFSLIVGYRDNGDTVVCRTYASHKGSGYVEMPLAELRGMLGKAWYVEGLRPDSGRSIGNADHVQALRTAVDFAKRKKSKSYACGFAAYEAWIEGIKGKDDAQSGELHANAYAYAILISSRRAAAEYLQRIAGSFEENAASHLRIAADLYEQIGGRLWEGRECVEHPWDENWTGDNRRLEAEIMTSNLADERRAIVEIERALETIWSAEP